VIAEAVGEKLQLDCVLPARSRVGIYCNSHRAQHTLIELLKGQLQPLSGYLAVATTDLRSLKAWQIRQEIIVLDRPVAVECTVREYLQLSASGNDETPIDVFTALRAVGLEETITQLSDGLDTPLASTGWPLSIAETMQLKLAAAMIAAPRVLVLSQVFDAVPEQYLLRSLDLFRDELAATVLLFTNKHTDFDCSHYLYLDHDQQTLFDSYAHMCERCGLDQRALREPLEGGGMALLPAENRSAEERP
jgi:putative ABC transport system ATP-binding protein